MLALLVLAVASADTEAQIRTKIDARKYREAFSDADAEIQRIGLLDTPPSLYYLRGYAAFNIEKYEQAITDMTRYLSSSSPDQKLSRTAHLVRGQSKFKLGLFDDADHDVTVSNDRAVQKQIKDSKAALERAQSFEKDGKLQDAYNIYTKLAGSSPAAVSFHIKAGELAYALGHKEKYLDHVHKASTLEPKNSNLLILKGKYYLGEGNIEAATKHFKLCMNTASDPSTCTALFRAVTRFNNNLKSLQTHIASKRYKEAADVLEKCYQFVEKYNCQGSDLDMQLKGYKVKLLQSEGKSQQALQYLNDLIEANPKSKDLLLQRGDIYLELEDYDSAMADYQAARKLAPNDKRILAAIQKVGKIQDDAKSVDYYEVLGLKKGCSSSEVKSAYRALVRKHHPDRFSNPTDKSKAERKMKRINQAFDVLSDPEKRKLYDMGQDPEAPNQGFQGGGFQGGGFQGGGFPPGMDPFNIFRQMGFGGFGGFGGGGHQNIRFEFRHN